jgi:phosphoserine phosphatase
MKLAVFDFDSTLMDGETIDFYAKELGIEKEISTITKKAMAGELDFFESLTSRVSLLKGLDYEKVKNISHNLPFMSGAKKTIKILKKNGYKVVCFSGGFDIATSYAKKELQFDADFSNHLHHINGKLTGEVGGYMMFSHSKGELLEKLQNTLGITKEQTLVVGDGANDLSMFKHANTRVAFCAKPILIKEANIIIDKKDLTLILNEIGL